MSVVGMMLMMLLLMMMMRMDYHSYHSYFRCRCTYLLHCVTTDALSETIMMRLDGTCVRGGGRGVVVFIVLLWSSLCTTVCYHC